MSDLILFHPKAELDAVGNLRGFIDACRYELTVYGANLPFEENIWDLTDWINLKGHGNKRHRLVFSNLETVNDNSPVPMAEPFLSFAKAYFRYMQGLRPITGIGTRITALRALESALRENRGEADPIHADALIFNRAAQKIVEKYSGSAAYRMGGQLEMLADFLIGNKLTTIAIKWRNFIKRPGDAVRVGKEFDERRREKMPSQAALDALPTIFRNAIEPIDVIVSSVAAILCAAPDRIGEVLSLQCDCEIWQERGDAYEKAYGLRWWPEKGAAPMIKWVVPSMVSVVQEAIEKIRNVTNEARRIAKWYEEHPRQLYLALGLEYLGSQEAMSMNELAEVLGFADGKFAQAWCRKNSISMMGSKEKRYARFEDVQNVVVEMLPEGFPLLDKEANLYYSEALFVVRVNELGAQRGTYKCMIEPISINQINVGLGSKLAHGRTSIFSRFGYVEPDGDDIAITTHQFRHYLNTLAQVGGLSQLDIAKWSGRKDIRQNAAYDHVTPGQMVQKIRDALGDGSTMFGPLAELSKKPLIPRDEFARLVIPTAHTSDLGYCIHDYTMSPCELHRDCIHCGELVCIKGDEAKERRLRQQLEEAKVLLCRAEQALNDECYGVDPWLEHQKSTLDRMSQLCSIIDDPKVPIGAVIQMSRLKPVDKHIMQQRRLESVDKTEISSAQRARRHQ